MTSDEMKAWIDAAPIEELLGKWRFGAVGSPWFQGEVGQHFKQVLTARRSADPDAWVRASKKLG